MQRSLGIAAKLALAIALFLLPVGYTIYQLYGTQQIAIDFGTKEAQGNAYLGQLRAAHGALLAGRDLPAIAAGIDRAGAQFGPGMESAEQHAALKAALDAGDAAAARAAIRALITRVGDKSNLILDPDLDSYYVMDLVLLKIPELMDQVDNVAAYAASHAASGGTGYSIADVAGFLQMTGAFDTLVGGTQASIGQAYDGSSGNIYDRVDLLPGLLQPGAEAMFASLAAFKASYAGSQLSAGEAALDLAAIGAARDAALDAVIAFGDANHAALDALLAARIASFQQDRIVVFATTALLFALAIFGVIFFIRRNVTRPIDQLAVTIEAIARDRTDIAVALTARGDELGRMARHVETFRAGVARRLELEAAARQETARRESQIRDIQALCGDFEQRFVAAVGAMMGSAGDLEQQSGVMRQAAEISGRQSENVAQLAEIAAGNAQSIASAVTEMSASFEEIGRQAESATETAGTAVGRAGEISRIVGGLTEVAAKVSGVLGLIRDIAGKTNLLALNATIEAARAGEAGKGFAVVATEVKNLAAQTTSATTEIESQIAGVQSAAQEAAGAISEIATIIEGMNQSTAAIFAAVTQQSAATQEIARNVTEATAKTREVASVITEVKSAAETTGARSDRVHDVAGSVSGQAGDLKAVVEGFLSRLIETAGRGQAA
ncbi:methyl-accepting chemotaxis protein [Dongia mobilis]|uniref:Methyl-accepting chemotaxis protein n=1 Tax=Dongia mobilis TaxID=578943 RepID=A0A4R6WRF7_9PROT|nr:methyl-accepting chemotaxis protein [Dongia mobilis]TDQ82041.1 methyl-accepting chemotaxis protein [Dongia mobilis]